MIQTIKVYWTEEACSDLDYSIEEYDSLSICEMCCETGAYRIVEDYQEIGACMKCLINSKSIKQIKIKHGNEWITL